MGGTRLAGRRSVRAGGDLPDGDGVAQALELDLAEGFEGEVRGQALAGARTDDDLTGGTDALAEY